MCCVLWWCSDGPVNSQEYNSFEIYAVIIRISMTEYHHWINGQGPVPLKKFYGIKLSPNQWGEIKPNLESNLNRVCIKLGEIKTYFYFIQNRKAGYMVRFWWQAGAFIFCPKGPFNVWFQALMFDFDPS